MAYDHAVVSQIDKDTVSLAVVGILCDFTDANDQSVKIHKSLFSPPIAPVSDVYLAIRKWRDSVIAGLNNKVALASAPQLEVGAVIPAAPAPAPATPASVWQSKASKLRTMQETKQAVTANGGTLNATFTAEITALAADVGSSYASGF